MARRSQAAKAKHGQRKADLEAELGKYQSMVRELMRSDESRLVKTQKQKVLHKKITDLKHQLESF